MKKVALQQINHFVSASNIAIAGASRNEKSFSANVVQHLSQRGYQLWLINPNFEKDDNQLHQLTSIDTLPPDVQHLLILTPPPHTEELVQQAIDKGIKHIWIQQQSETQGAIDLAIDKGINVIHHECIFMFTQPAGFHKFHRTIKQFFGTMPI